MRHVLGPVSVFLTAALTLVACSDARRGAVSPSAILLPEQTTSWVCGRVAADAQGATTSNGWSFHVPTEACPGQPWRSSIEYDGLVTTAPGNLRSTVTQSTVRLEWEPTAGATSFQVEAGSATLLKDLAVFNTGSAGLVLVVTNVPSGVYYVRVRGVGPDGIAGPASNEIVVRVGTCAGPPGAPVGLNAQVSGNLVTLSWAAAGEAAASYIIEAGSASGLSNIVVFDSGSAVPGLSATAPNGIYYVRVRGRNACGTGSASNELTIDVPNGVIGEPCRDYRVSPTQVALSAIAGEFFVRVDTDPGCAWSASAESPFITLSGSAQRTGSGTAQFRVTANTGPAVRDGRARIAWTGAGQLISVSQIAPPVIVEPSPPVDDVIIVVPDNNPGVGEVIEVPSPPPPTQPQGPTLNGPLWTPVNRGVRVGLTANEPFNKVIVGSRTGPSDNRLAYDVSGSHYVIALTEFRQAIDLTFELQSDRPADLQFAVAVGTALPRNYVSVLVDPKTPPPPCTYAVTPTNIPTIGAGGGTFAVDVTTAAGCAWTASSSDSFITVTSGSGGSGNGTARFSVAPNSGAGRNGRVRIAWSGSGQDITVPQAGLTDPCSALSLTGPPLLSSGAGTFDVTVEAAAGCAWTASSLTSFVSVTSAAGSGNGTARFAITANPATTVRYATIRVQSGATVRDVIVSQSGTECTYAVAGPTSPLGSGAGTFDVTVATAPGCAWTASSLTSFVTVTAGAGNGNGTARFSIGANPGTSTRSATVRIQGSGVTQDFTVQQNGGPSCAVSVDPTFVSMPWQGGSFSFTVTATSGCSWTATSQNSFITGGPFTRDGTTSVTFNVMSAGTPSVRTGSVRVAWNGGERFVTVSQAAPPCFFGISNRFGSTPNLIHLGGHGATYSSFVTVTVTAQAPTQPSDCVWSAASQASWMTVVSGSPTAGSGSITVRVDANPGAFRSGVMRISWGGGSYDITVQQDPAIIGASARDVFSLRSPSSLPLAGSSACRDPEPPANLRRQRRDAGGECAPVLLRPRRT
jgi:hypothetical protein